MTEQPTGPVREHLAWLIWCMSEGYVKAEDRAILSNWLLDDPATLHPHDAELRPHLLGMADEILTSLIRQATADEIAAAILAARTDTEDEYFGCLDHAAEIARRVGGGGGGGGGQ
jgi:hypothetical protein